MPDSRRYVAPSWDDIYMMLLDLASKIRGSGFRPDLIVGVSRGGWVPARILSDLLENQRTVNVKIEFYVGLEKTTRKPVVTQPVTEEITGQKVLIADDVSDTGESLRLAVDHIRQKGAGDTRTVTIFFKPHSKFKPDFFAQSTADWIIFPWERLEAVKLMLQEAKTEGRGSDSVRATLRMCNLPDDAIDSLFRLADGTR